MARGPGRAARATRQLLRPAAGARSAAAPRPAADGRLAPLDWARLFTGQAPDPLALRRFILVQPVPDYAALAPVSAAVDAVRAEAARLGLTAQNGVRIRLTGDLAMADEEFATVFGSAIVENILSLVAVAVLLWLACAPAG